eukprot:m.477855 g.477855  ORF g.477855 m.477855 type:complete len:51 (+) comp20964_c0_seq1:1152-1304(+)
MLLPEGVSFVVTPVRIVLCCLVFCDPPFIFICLILSSWCFAAQLTVHHNV